jgi:hypothetical protein
MKEIFLIEENMSDPSRPRFGEPTYAEAARYILNQIERAGLEEPRRIVRLTEHLAALTKAAAIADIRRN